MSAYEFFTLPIRVAAYVVIIVIASPILLVLGRSQVPRDSLE